MYYTLYTVDTVQTQHHTSLTPPTHHTSLTQLVKVSVISSYVQSDLSSSHTAAGPTHSTPHPLITYQHYLKDLYSPEYPGYSKPQFTRHRPKQIVNLALVHKRRMMKETSYSESASSTSCTVI